MADTTKIIDMVRKLRAHAEHGRTVEEQAAFAGKVKDLMDRYRINEADVAGFKADARTFVGAATWIGGPTFTAGDIRIFIPLLACTIGTAYACRAVMVEGRAKVHFVGREADRVVAVFMMDYLSRAAVSLCDRAQKKHRAAFPDGDRSHFRADFLHGFVCCIDERYKERRDQMLGALVVENNTQALMRLTNELTIVDRWLATADAFKGAATGYAESAPVDLDAANEGVGAAIDQCLDTNGIHAGEGRKALR